MLPSFLFYLWTLDGLELGLLFLADTSAASKVLAIKLLVPISVAPLSIEDPE